MKKPRKLTTRKEDIGKLLLDFGKLIFGSIFLGNILRGDILYTIIAAVGFLATAVLCFIGILLVTKEKKNGDNSPTKQE